MQKLKEDYIKCVTKETDMLSGVGVIMLTNYYGKDYIPANLTLS